MAKAKKRKKRKTVLEVRTLALADMKLELDEVKNVLSAKDRVLDVTNERLSSLEAGIDRAYARISSPILEPNFGHLTGTEKLNRISKAFRELEAKHNTNKLKAKEIASRLLEIV